jgi:hypothetical protein
MATFTDEAARRVLDGLLRAPNKTPLRPGDGVNRSGVASDSTPLLVT